MSLSSLQNGIFEDIGDTYVLQLAPISGVNNFSTFSDVTTGVNSPTKIFTKEFRYRKNSGVFSSFIALTPVALASITSIITDIWDLEIRYTRAGSDNSGIMSLKCFILEGINVTPCVIVKIAKTKWDAVYGTSKFFEIDAKVSEFNREQKATNSTYVFLVVDESLPDRDMIFERVGTCIEDMNINFQTIFGNLFIDNMLEDRVDTYDGLRTP